MMNQYTLGKGVNVTGAFTDTAGADLDPATVSLSVRKPDGTSLGPYTYASSAVTRTSQGHYVKTIVVDVPGVWVSRWDTTGVAGSTAPVEEAFRVLPSEA